MEAAILWIPLLAIVGWVTYKGYEKSFLLFCWGAMLLGIIYSLGSSLLR